jgi:UDP-N-acetylglucosamine diphosphorylase/glucosamine-1-phosphate N-acetyltransferase
MLVLIDNKTDWQNLLPLTFTKPIAQLRVGILTIGEKWQKHLQIPATHTFYLTEKYLQTKYNSLQQTDSQVITYINASITPEANLLKLINKLPMNGALLWQDTTIALKTNDLLSSQDFYDIAQLKTRYQLHFLDFKPTAIAFPYHIFRENRNEIIKDFALLTAGRTSEPITDLHTKIYGAENIFVEAGASIKAAILNAEDAPIYIGKNAKIHEGAIIKGAFALCEGAEINMGAKIKGDTTVGIYSKVGGEVSNSVIMGYSNKGHDGFLGNSVIGEWCNLGADTNTSNLKNTYNAVSIWNIGKRAMQDTGLQFCGTIMADHVKCSINTMLNTGTVIGVGANLFGAGFPPKYVPSFAWGGAEGFEKFRFDKFCEMAARVMERRNLLFGDVERELLLLVYESELN